MAETKLIRDHHLFTRDTVKNVSGDLTLDIAGDINLDAGGQDINFQVGETSLLNWNATAGLKMMSASDTGDYFKILVASLGVTTLSTVDNSGNNVAKLVLQPQGELTLTPAANEELKATITTKTASSTLDSTFRLTETLDLDAGAGGSDVHYGIWYTQTQTDLTGWDDVYLMYLDGGNKFTVDDKAQLNLDVNNTSITASTTKGITVDIDKTGIINDGSLNTILSGISVTINTDAGGGHGSSTNSNIGLDINLTGNTYGASHVNTGINIAVASASTNYALITSGGNVGIGVADPDTTLEILNTSTQLKLSYDATNYATFTTSSSADLTIATVGSGTTDSDLTLDVDGSIILDSADGGFEMHGAGTTAKFADMYAGMILGYTTVGIDAATDYYTLSSTWTVPDDDLKVKFVAPPSGVVEIFVSVYADTTRRLIEFGLSDANATTGYSPIDFPNSNDVTNEHLVFRPGATTDEEVIQNYWVVTGLTAGTAYEWWFAASLSSSTGGVLRWGGTISGQYPPFIMKATALPAATPGFAVYG